MNENYENNFENFETAEECNNVEVIDFCPISDSVENEEKSMAETLVKAGLVLAGAAAGAAAVKFGTPAKEFVKEKFGEFKADREEKRAIKAEKKAKKKAAKEAKKAKKEPIEGTAKEVTEK